MLVDPERNRFALNLFILGEETLARLVVIPLRIRALSKEETLARLVATTPRSFQSLRSYLNAVAFQALLP